MATLDELVDSGKLELILQELNQTLNIRLEENGLDFEEANVESFEITFEDDGSGFEVGIIPCRRCFKDQNGVLRCVSCQ